ncbi:zinc-binding alcohol dehydrogenase family protein [Synechococcus sp. BA-124 BA4]|jgi:NADPH:quinone reductase|uniref:zinc-binding alcohol dehydrogenase family protein n=1 Tax=unclassified Synechococcus TaxID=2626047 RepID=UPI001E3B8318|nr:MULTISPECIES: zinc-binding alcohol dehydrogenase family protein [unclassified Synechococcus]MEA5398751.1 zinc-binding alcohol dehydrogenase family protein [Synechococcus sp. BA-124 BA4]CAK6694395.1 Zinc-type alcohol dehydrogenase-like protein [Synechococcus sp. CBW1107]
MSMKAVTVGASLHESDPRRLQDRELPIPTPSSHDLLVAVAAVAVNPVDLKVRDATGADSPAPRVLGWDASGVVRAVGAEVSLFRVGDAVFYAGEITRPGSNAEFQLVDERLAGRKPRSLSFAEAAALPLTTITAFESLFHRLRIPRDGSARGQTILLIGAAGGVGSIAIQLASRAGLTVIATASRASSIAWVQELGAQHVVNHHRPLVEQVRALGPRFVDHIAIFSDMGHWPEAVELIRPQGGIVCIEATDQPMPMAEMKTKAASLHWEYMFARALHQTPDMIEQHHLLNQVADEIDAGRLRTTVTGILRPINAANLEQAHARIASGEVHGKIVLEGF